MDQHHQFALRDVIGVLADANLLGDPERRSRWGSAYSAEHSARDLVKRLAKAFAKRLGKKVLPKMEGHDEGTAADEAALRVARETLAAELLQALQRVDREAFAQGAWPRNRGTLPDGGWAGLSDRELARRLVSQRLDTWGHPYDSAVNETVTLIAAEFCANAVTHGRLPGRDFHLRLAIAAAVIRVEVSDARTERQPLLTRDDSPAEAESGRGLLLVEALASRWDTGPLHPAPGKTVWAEVDCPVVVS